MQVKENVGQDRERAIARRFIVLNAEDRAENLGLFGLFQAFDFFLALYLNRFLQVGDVLADTINQPYGIFFSFFFGPSSPRRSGFSLSGSLRAAGSKIKPT